MSGALMLFRDPVLSTVWLAALFAVAARAYYHHPWSLRALTDPASALRDGVYLSKLSPPEIAAGLWAGVLASGFIRRRQLVGLTLFIYCIAHGVAVERGWFGPFLKYWGAGAYVLLVFASIQLMAPDRPAALQRWARMADVARDAADRRGATAVPPEPYMPYSMFRMPTLGLFFSTVFAGALLSNKVAAGFAAAFMLSVGEVYFTLHTTSTEATIFDAFENSLKRLFSPLLDGH
jgi:hypothetical protein